MNTQTKSFSQFLVLSGALFILGACSTGAPDGMKSGHIDDPFEEYNRAAFAFNNAVDDAFINPVVEGYRAVTPQFGRDGVRNFLRNLKSPITFLNQALQGDAEGAGDVILRAVINTFVGVGGLFDVAGKEGIEYEAEDFGQTLGVWGVGHGPYLVVPVLGPSSLRDYAGYAVDSFADPLRWYLHNTDEEGLYYTKVGVDYLDLRESLIDVLQELEASSIDYYAAVKSAYVQRRNALVADDISNATEAPAPSIPDFDDE